MMVDRDVVVLFTIDKLGRKRVRYIPTSGGKSHPIVVSNPESLSRVQPGGSLRCASIYYPSSSRLYHPLYPPDTQAV